MKTKTQTKLKDIEAQFKHKNNNLKMMKKLVSLSMLLFVAIAFFTCGDEVPPVDTNAADIALLTKTWTCSSAKLAGVEQDGYKDALKLSISKGADNNSLAFTAAGRNITETTKSVWPESGSFKIDAETLSLTRNDGSLATTYAVTASVLTLSFTYEGDGFSRTDGTNEIKGSWSFTFAL